VSASDSMNPFGGWDDTLPVCVTQVIRRWTTMHDHEPPWAGMSRDDVLGMMRPLLSELLNEARDVDHERRRRRLVMIAHDHGAFRSSQRCSEADVLAELELAREAVELSLRQAGMSARAAREMLATLDAEFALAQRASVRGWYRGRMRGTMMTGTWFDRLLEELE
jgi:hypothetical protein